MKKRSAGSSPTGVLAALVALTLLLAATLPVYAHGGDLAADGCHRRIAGQAQYRASALP